MGVTPTRSRRRSAHPEALLLRTLFPLLLLAACATTPDGDGTDTAADTGDAAADADLDGYTEDVDCDDHDDDVHPDATELCNGLDDDCDGDTDGDATDTTTVYTDADGDLHGDPATAAQVCTPAADQVALGDDCDDAVGTTFPGADERCNDTDDDCDSDVDEDAVDATAWYPDDDLDGYGDDAMPVMACSAPEAAPLSSGGDCDDTDAAVHPGVTERCDGVDEDCDASTPDTGVWLDMAGTWYDYTDLVGAGTVDAPFSSSVYGTDVHVCDGTWYLQLTFMDSGSMVGHGTSAPPVVSPGTTGSAVRLFGSGSSVVTVQDLDIVAGNGSYASYSGISSSGGGVLCDSTGGDTLLLDHVSITDSPGAYAGGAVATYNCDVTIQDSTLTGNAATYGGALLIYNPSATVTVEVIDSVIEDNDASYGGGAYIEGYTASTLALVGTRVDGNAASSGGGLLVNLASVVTCEGDASSSAGLRGNEAVLGGGVYLSAYGYGASFASTSCDFGADGSTDDNTDEDVMIADGGTLYDYGDDATFTCSSTGCL